MTTLSEATSRHFTLQERAAVLDAANIAFVGVDVDGLVRLVNHAMCELVGRQAHDLVGRATMDFTHPDDADQQRQLVAQRPMFEGQFEKRLVRPDGEIVWARLVASWDPEAGLEVGQLYNITELVEARESARAAAATAAGASQLSQALVEHSADIVALLDGDGRLLQSNPAGDRILGWKRGEWDGSSVLELVHPDDVATVSAALEETFRTPGLQAPVSMRLATQSGGWLHLDAVGNNQLDNPEVGGIVINAHDVTTRVTSLHALMQALTRATEYRDPYTAGHQLAVAELAHDTGQRLGLTEADCRTLRLGAALHDLGKIAVPAEILTKPGRLTEAEMMMIRTHPQIGHDILADIEFAEPVRDMVLHHHERLDGSGYPDGLAGDEIAVSTRIVTTADVADAMRAHRPYRPSLGNAVAEEHLRAHSGTLYDADVVEAVIDVLRARDRAPAAAG